MNFRFNLAFLFDSGGVVGFFKYMDHVRFVIKRVGPYNCARNRCPQLISWLINEISEV